MPDTIHTHCCIVGGGPAGMMAAFLLARAGIHVAVLEKHADFFRDFRGDTIHPSTLRMIDELGLLDAFLQIKHQEVRQVHAVVGDKTYQMADFTKLPIKTNYTALMPQWDFLAFLADHARKYPTFHLHMQTEATRLIEENGKIIGVGATSKAGPLEFRAPLTLAADGRHSTMRTSANLRIEDLGAPIDVLWMRISRHRDDPDQVVGRFDKGAVFVLIDRGDYWQCGFVIAKGGYDTLRKEGLPAFHQRLLAITPFLKNRVEELDDWDKIKLLTVTVDHLFQWHKPGLLCIGDAAHAMSPVGGVGINLAVQDAVAAANLLWKPLKENRVTEAELARIQKRREVAARKTQSMQLYIHRRFLTKALQSNAPAKLPLLLRIVLHTPFLRGLPARIIGLGYQPEHIESPELPPNSSLPAMMDATPGVPCPAGQGPRWA